MFRQRISGVFLYCLIGCHFSFRTAVLGRAYASAQYSIIFTSRVALKRPNVPHFLIIVALSLQEFLGAAFFGLGLSVIFLQVFFFAKT